MVKMVMKNKNIGARKLLNLRETDPGSVWCILLGLYCIKFHSQCELFKQNKISDFPCKTLKV